MPEAQLSRSEIWFLRQTSYIKCEDVRSVSKERLHERCGSVLMRTLAAIEDRLRILLGL